MQRVSALREFAWRSTAALQVEREAVLGIDLEGQQAIWPQECYLVERHIASSTLQAGLGSPDGTFVDGHEDERTTAYRDAVRWVAWVNR